MTHKVRTTIYVPEHLHRRAKLSGLNLSKEFSVFLETKFANESTHQTILEYEAKIELLKSTLPDIAALVEQHCESFRRWHQNHRNLNRAARFDAYRAYIFGSVIRGEVGPEAFLEAYMQWDVENVPEIVRPPQQQALNEMRVIP